MYSKEGNNMYNIPGQKYLEDKHLDGETEESQTWNDQNDQGVTDRATEQEKNYHSEDRPNDGDATSMKSPARYQCNMRLI